MGGREDIHPASDLRDPDGQRRQEFGSFVSEVKRLKVGEVLLHSAGEAGE